MRPKRRHIIIKDRSLPFSKGLLASSIMATGLSSAEAFGIAERVEEHMTVQGRHEVSSNEIRDLAASMLSEIDERFASRYLQWQAVDDVDCPLIILLGGATGVGKSTIATQLAARLHVTRVISTDAIREVLRAAVSRELLPTLHASSFQADTSLRVPPPEFADPVIVGFQEQVQAVSVGIKALIARSVEEGTPIIVEGAHVVPGYLSGWEEEFPDAVLVPVVLTVTDEETHKSHFLRRSTETKSRPGDRYLAGFGNIRLIQSYICRLAAENGVPLVEMFELDSTLQEIVAVVVAKALASARLRDEIESSIPESFFVTAGGEVVQKEKPTRRKGWEILGKGKKGP
ncbi:MAG: AAA family ATPase [Actinomycetota bacterium]